MKLLFPAVILCLISPQPTSAAEFAGGFDCPTDASEAAGTICHDGDLAGLNADLRQAYTRVLPAIPEQQRDMLRQAQQEWLSTLMDCTRRARHDEEIECLNRKMGDQIALLTGAPLSGSLGGFALAAFAQKPDDVDRVSHGLYLRFANPATAGQIEYNRIVDALVAGARSGVKTVGEPPTPDEQWGFVDLKLTYASPQLISLKLVSFYGCGDCGDEAVRNENFNIDMATGNLIDIAKTFSPSSIVRLAIRCREQIVPARAKFLREQLSNPNYEPDGNELEQIAWGIGDVITDQRNWSIGETETVVSFPVNTVGGYLDMGYQCTFPTNEVRQLAREGSPLR